MSDTQTRDDEARAAERAQRAELERAELERMQLEGKRAQAFVTRSFSVEHPPSIEEVAAVQKFFVDRRDELTREVSEIEAMLGFVVQSSELSVRVAKIELFLGIK